MLIALKKYCFIIIYKITFILGICHNFIVIYILYITDSLVAIYKHAYMKYKKYILKMLLH
jgi:hypothetical protein